MKVFIAGATGVLGRRLIRQLRERGHAVSGLARNAKNEETIRSLGGEPRSGDLFEPNSLARAAEGAEGGESTRRRRFLSPRSLRPQTGK